MTTIPIRTAMPPEQGSIIAMLALAFSTDPGAHWIYPDPHRYISHFPDVVKAFGRRSFQNGTAYYVDGFLGAALWLPPGMEPH